ncbi:Uncharacterised protein [Campylobacter insulaenigrae]|uniref:hypothetical protein n=1 Tax=Campylobacter insulaenigrae TaxID=260714 RepID=UPI000F6D6705|nr:hypothetical protein [Campylobacter insulaenigrae]MCR6590497.1 hypothetical protein [Campylobacter insulaenigrae]MCR6592034.1 hypothetical protein [Campylobacter insulaenigrae]VEJ53299.1 Uncharacterised protein [Campylobacter insulaenigrae]
MIKNIFSKKTISLNNPKNDTKLDENPKQNKSDRLEKIIHTWVVNCTKYSLKNPHDKRRINRKNGCIKFVLNIFEKTKNKNALIGISSSLYDKYKNLYKSKLARVKQSSKIKSLQEKYPNLDIINAYKYAILSNKYALLNEDIEDFENIIKILLQLNTAKDKQK